MDYTIDDVHRILDEAAKAIPEELFKELNGGIILLDEIKIHDKAKNNDLFVLGTYNRFGVMKQINIYYQSIKRVYPILSEERLYEILLKLLKHEIQHHTEYMARLRDLEIEDENMINRYLEK